jgi:hypothetical protein
MRNSLFRAFVTASAMLVAAGVLPAQNQMMIGSKAGTYEFLSVQAGAEGKVVTGKPYSAEGVTETKRVLSDGTTITRESRSKIYRDSEGRTRREMTVTGIGPLAAEGEPTTTVTVNDPVTGMAIVTHTEGKLIEADGMSKSAKREVHVKRVAVGDDKSSGAVKAGDSASGSQTTEATIWIESDGANSNVVRTHDFTAMFDRLHSVAEGEAKEEDLGERVIDGLVARGTRTTTVIPEGEIGNDQDITITHESWYSDEIEALVRSETKDPMTGTATYRLTNIVRSEPDPSLFDMPEDVNVITSGGKRKKVVTKIERQPR